MAEKLPRKSHCHAWTERRFEKRRQAKQDRAQAKRDPENAPTRRAYSGWPIESGPPPRLSDAGGVAPAGRGP